MKNFKLNKKKLLSLLVAGGISLCSFGEADIISYNNDVTLVNGQPAKLYFTTTVNDMEYGYVTYNNTVGYVNLSDVNMENIIPNAYFIEDQRTLMVNIDEATLYSTPSFNGNGISFLRRNDSVNILATTIDGWYAVYANGTCGFMHKDCFVEKKNEDTIIVAKLTKNNVNVRSSATTKEDNIIGFSDITDYFTILGKENNWYIVDYLGQTGYIREDFIKEIEINKEDLEISRMAYLTSDTYFYKELNNDYDIILPMYQNVGIIKEEGSYYKVMVDGIVGYVSKSNVKKLSRTCVVIDLARQILRVYKNGDEVFRAHIISGRESLPTGIGCFKVGHKVKGYQLTVDNYVDYWIEYDGNRGIHDASWQKNKYYGEVANHAYDNFASGHGKTYPYKHGSHGCSNMMYDDVRTVYNLVSVGDNVLVIGPNNLIRNKLISKIEFNNYLFESEEVKVKKLV